MTIIINCIGSQPFEHESYGDEITVVRTIQAEGPTKYQVLDSSGRVPEGKETNMRQQIQKLCAHWNLKVCLWPVVRHAVAECSCA